MRHFLQNGWAELEKKKSQAKKNSIPFLGRNKVPGCLPNSIIAKFEWLLIEVDTWDNGSKDLSDDTAHCTDCFTFLSAKWWKEQE